MTPLLFSTGFREGLATKRGDVKDVMNYCLNATLARTLLTSVTTLFIVIVLYLFGGPALRNFALVLIIGVMIGTYSSIFIASPIVLWWARKNGINLRRESPRHRAVEDRSNECCVNFSARIDLFQNRKNTSFTARVFLCLAETLHS